MSRVSSKSSLSPSVARGSSAIDLGKSDVNTSPKNEISATSGGVGITREITSIGGLQITGGASVDISPLGFDVTSEGPDTVSVAASAEIPGGILGVSGGVSINTSTGEVTGGSIGGEVAGIGLEISKSENGFGLGVSFQIPGTPVSVSLGFESPPLTPPAPPPTMPGNEMPADWEPTTPQMPNSSLSPGLYYVRRTSTGTDGRYWYSDGNGFTTYEVKPPRTGAPLPPSISPSEFKPEYCFEITQSQINSSTTLGGGTYYRTAGANDSYYPMNRFINRIESSSAVRYMPPYGLISQHREIYYRRMMITKNFGYASPSRYIFNEGDIVNPLDILGFYQLYFPGTGWGEGSHWEWMEWQLISSYTIELAECGEKPPALSTPTPFPNPPPRKEEVDTCCQENLKMLRAIYKGLGIAKFPGKLPATIIQEVVKKGQKPAEPEQVPIADFVDLLDWQFRRDDERWGQWEIQIDVKDADLTKEGDQGKSIKFPNLAESIAELEGQMLSVMANVDALVAITTKGLVESGMARQEAIKSYLAAKAIIKYMAFKSTEIDVPVPMAFTAGAETISALIKESEGHIKGTDYVEKETLRDILLDLLQAAAVIRAVHWQKIDSKTDTKSQLLSLLKGTVDLAGIIASPKKSNDGEKKFDPTQNFEDFLDSAEDGFRNTTGITDIQNPYGKTPDRRPRIRQIGDNISQAGGDN